MRLEGRSPALRRPGEEISHGEDSEMVGGPTILAGVGATPAWAGGHGNFHRHWHGGPGYYRPWYPGYGYGYGYYRPYYPVYVAPPPVIVQSAPVIQQVPVVQQVPVAQPTYASPARRRRRR